MTRSLAMKNVERFCFFLGSYIAPSPPSRACRDTALTSHVFNTAEDLNCFDGKPRNFRITESRGEKEVTSSLALGGMPKYGIHDSRLFVKISFHIALRELNAFSASWYQTLNNNRDSDHV